ncbi:carbohydrate ABC transporter permease [Microlunatus parietis]|uniref:Multiple sugar transport system permease protein/putative aldouronate transport system permease protein n=1 Tax=Microlunatus parietis TaxID=682979 RepID=A0A7Y9IDX6_9ACTN|nr:carbohydrate ABC transporter permease [Microlunatus parietis]NYE74464.1 multiple sugar transport system permease protein/putative aldouronate transport system permease protein [Microlunatus parietis]
MATTTTSSPRKRRKPVTIPGMSQSDRLRAINGAKPPSIPIRMLKGVVLLIASLLVIMPFVAVISTSLADQEQINAAGGYVLFPTNPTFAAYEAIFRGGVVTRATIVSILITVVGSALSVTVVTMLAYALSRPGTFAHRPILLMVLFTMLFSAGMIPNYLLVKQLGLIDSYWALILPTMVSGFQVILMRGFFLEVPKEIIEAARIDGAGEFRILTTIMVPLSKAALAVIALFNAVSYWNAFFNAVLYINSTEKWPLQLVLRTYVVDNSSIGVDLPGDYIPPQQSLQMAILVVSLVPICLVYPFLQKHFAKGVIIGAVKG